MLMLVSALLVLSMHTNQTRASSSLIFSQMETSGCRRPVDNTIIAYIIVTAICFFSIHSGKYIRIVLPHQRNHLDYAVGLF
jgi:hypothetical protein